MPGYVKQPWQDSNRTLASPLRHRKKPSVNQTQKTQDVSNEESDEYRVKSVHGILPGANIKTLRDTRVCEAS
jgi:hypothetical protein